MADGDLSLLASRGNELDLVELSLPPAYLGTPSALTGPAVNVARVYTRLAGDLKNDTHQAPDFGLGVRMHRLLDAIRAGAEHAVALT